MPISHEQAIMKSNAYNDLRDCLGYLGNGSHRSVTISQDDATKSYVIHVGDHYKTRRLYHGETLAEALRQAGKAEREYNS